MTTNDHLSLGSRQHDDPEPTDTAAARLTETDAHVMIDMVKATSIGLLTPVIVVSIRGAVPVRWGHQLRS